MEVWVRDMVYFDTYSVRTLLESGNLSTDLRRTKIRLTAWLDRKLVGFCAVEFWGEYASLRGLIVRKDYRKRGVGKALVDKAVKDSLTRGMKGVFAYTYFWNIPFYATCGFERIEKYDAPEPIKECAAFHHPKYRCCCLLKFKED